MYAFVLSILISKTQVMLGGSQAADLFTSALILILIGCTSRPRFLLSIRQNSLGTSALNSRIKSHDVNKELPVGCVARAARAGEFRGNVAEVTAGWGSRGTSCRSLLKAVAVRS